MCQFCDAELENKGKEEQETRCPQELDDCGSVSSCKSFENMQERESSMEDSLSAHAVPMISPSTSLSSRDSIVSNSSDVSVDTNLSERVYPEECTTDINQEDVNSRPNGHMQNSSAPTHVRGKLSNGCSERDAKAIGTSVGQRAGDHGVENDQISNEEETETFSRVEDQMDARMWFPPEPEDQEDDLECSVANFDDDEEFDDGTNWGEPSSLSNFGEEGGVSYRYKEEREKALTEVRNGKFKDLVGHLLKSVGIEFSLDDGDSWVDVVTDLSWKAATFVKPNAIKGKAMDLDGYVKVKCIATGARKDSELIRGLVFKKHAAHKHMQTKYKKPTLLLIEGSLGMSSNELSSFDSMKQENDSVKSIIEMIELCHPNVILVEKTVSRDIQEQILAKGITLVLDMKLHRLERVARCTGASILSSNISKEQKLKQCDSFHFEKFVEEHALLESGKKPCKTLMFLEGCPTRLGCTILLKGSSSNELKKIKCVLQYAVVMAYHLILETSFLLDQNAMFSTAPFNGVPNVLPTGRSPSNGSGDSKIYCLKETDSSSASDIPVSSGGHEEGSDNINLDGEANFTLPFEPYDPVIMSDTLSASLKKVIDDNFPLFSSSGQSLSTRFDLNSGDLDNQNRTSVSGVASPDACDDCDLQERCSSDEEKALYHEQCYGQIPLETQNSDFYEMDQLQSKDDISKVLESESILVLMSKRNASKGTICEQSRFSHIKFYRSFDDPLGKFLRNNLLNQIRCPECTETPEAHIYYYAHHSKQLIIQVKCLPESNCLPRGAEEKLWMWSRCGKCKRDGKSGSTKRVLLSSAARDLSFGKFLELGFSNHSSFSRLCSCGHSLHKDFLYFFGLGRMVAMFRYSSIATYSVSMPPQKLQFSNLIRAELLKEEAMQVYEKGNFLFSEVEKSLQKIESRFTGRTLNNCGSLKDFSDIRELLKKETCQFEMNIQNKILKNGVSDEAIYRPLYLNQLLLEIVLESCLWERRLASLLSSESTVIDTKTTQTEAQDKTSIEENTTAIRQNGGAEDILECGEEVYANGGIEEINPGESEVLDEEIFIEGSVQESGEPEDSLTTNGVVDKDIDEDAVVGITNECGSSDQDTWEGPNCSSDYYVGDNLNLSAGFLEERTIPLTTDTDDGDRHLDASLQEALTSPILGNTESPGGWIWTPFPDIGKEYMKDLFVGYRTKFGPVSSQTAESLSAAYKQITEEVSKLYIPLGIDDYVVSDYEDELSSIIACALGLLKDIPIPAEDLDDHSRKEKGLAGKLHERSPSLSRLSSLTSPRWSSISSWDSDVIHSSSSFSSDESLLSSFDGSSLLDSLVSLGVIHPEVCMGVDKLTGKTKYSVTCLYAGRFRNLRSQFCPSELDYIASLSRCRKWDAKGGKSKSFFAKTLDDRFIIKEIKRTEFESFTKFAPDYFKYMNESIELGNQTCLAKILGIYQVTIRQGKSGKELKHDLMVMENLTFGRTITRQYDLKGALHARFTTAADGPGDVLLDQNFVNDVNASPMYVKRRSKRLLQRAVWNDTTFLNSINVMDYSLLVGVDPQGRELVCGIIDYLRQYTWDKQLETWVKSSLVVPKNQLPTVISPKEYTKRFRKFMSKHLLSVPDHWCSHRSSNPCKLCGSGDDESK